MPAHQQNKQLYVMIIIQRDTDMEPSLVKPRARQSKFVKACYEQAENLVSALVAIAVIFLFLARFAGVLGDSMLPTLHEKDWLGVTSFPAQPKRGQIVIISPRVNAHHAPLVKRVIAVGGDEVDIRGGRVYVNGNLLEELYLPEGTVTEPAPWHQNGELTYPVIVPEGSVFVLGDNRGASSDSRFEAVGFVRVEDIFGRVLFRASPFYSKETGKFTMRVK